MNGTVTAKIGEDWCMIEFGDKGEGATAKMWRMKVQGDAAGSLPFRLGEKVQLTGEEDDILCPKCGSCGEEGCCPPDNCKTVQGYYCEGSLRSYRSLEDQWDKMRTALKAIAPGNLSGRGCEMVAKEAMVAVDELMRREAEES